MSENRLLPVYCSFALSGLCLLGLVGAVTGGPVSSWNGLGFLMLAGFSVIVAAAVMIWFGVWQWRMAPRVLRVVAVANVIVPIAAIFAFFKYAR